jgi:hypothetical protein
MGMSDNRKADLKDNDNPVVRDELVIAAADTAISFQRSLESWLMASIQANYSKSDEQMLKTILEKCSRMLEANAHYHEDVSKVLTESEPVIARQHRILANIYRALNANHKTPSSS